jgi:hypothetical protein
MSDTSANTLEDLRYLVGTKIQQSIGGKEIDVHETEVTLEEMLGIVEVGETANFKDRQDTIFQPTHPFWEQWHSDIESTFEAQAKIEAAIASLKDDDILELPFIYENDDIVVPDVDVSQLNGYAEIGDVHTECTGCGEPIVAVSQFKPHGKTYKMVLEIDCHNCEKDETFVQQMTRWEK